MVASHKKVIDNLNKQIHATDTLREAETVIHEARLAKARTESQTGNEYIRHANEIMPLLSKDGRLGEEVKRAEARNKQELARLYESMGRSPNGLKLQSKPVRR